MYEPSALIEVVLLAAGLGLTVLARAVLPQFRGGTLLSAAALLAASIAGLTGVYWLVAGSRADQLPGAVLAAGGVVGLATRPPRDAGPSAP